MFIGTFNGNFHDSTAAQGGTLRHGVLCGDGVVCYSANDVSVVFWGVVYNKTELGFAPHASNACVAWELYQRSNGHDDKPVNGESLALLDGSFTAIIRTPRSTTILRDHHGTGDQVYYNSTHFGSSLALILSVSGQPSEVNFEALSQFLSTGYIPTGSSSIRGVAKLSAGSMLIAEQGMASRVVDLFPVKGIEPAGELCDLEELSERYGRLHRRAILRRIGDSSNVGMLLSGGYDSGGNLAALRQVYGGDVRSFSIGFRGDNWSELPLARCMADEFGTIHSEYEIDGSEILGLPQIVDHLGDPFIEGGLMVNYSAMRMVGPNRPDVILGGDGSDQYFGTSAREVALHYLAAKNGLKPLMQLASSMLDNNLSDSPLPYRLRFHLNRVAGVMNGDTFGFEKFRLRHLLLNPDHLHTHQATKPDTRSFEHLYTQHLYESDIKKVIDQVILFKASRMADMFGNAIAFPFMDMELYDFLRQLPVSYKCKSDSVLDIARGRFTSKFLLKHHYKPLLPEKITNRKKQGGFAPMPLFFSDKVQRQRLGQYIMESNMVGDYLDRRRVAQFLASYDLVADNRDLWFWQRQSMAIQFLNLLTLAIWWQRYVGSKTIATL